MWHASTFAVSKGYLRTVAAVHGRSAGPRFIKVSMKTREIHGREIVLLLRQLSWCETLTLKLPKLGIERGGLELGTRWMCMWPDPITPPRLVFATSKPHILTTLNPSLVALKNCLQMWAPPNSEGERAPFPDVWPAYPHFLNQGLCTLVFAKFCKCNKFRFTRRTMVCILLAQEGVPLFFSCRDAYASVKF